MLLDKLKQFISLRFQNLPAAKIASLMSDESAKKIQQMTEFLGFHGPLELLRCPNFTDPSHNVSDEELKAIANYAVDHKLSFVVAACLFKVSLTRLSKFMSSRRAMSKPLTTPFEAKIPEGASLEKAFDPLSMSFDESLYEQFNGVEFEGLKIDLKSLRESSNYTDPVSGKDVTFLDEKALESDVSPLPGDGIGRAKAAPNRHRSPPSPLSYEASQKILAEQGPAKLREVENQILAERGKPLRPEYKPSKPKVVQEVDPNAPQNNIFCTTDENVLNPYKGIPASEYLKQLDSTEKKRGRTPSIDVDSECFDQLPASIQIRELRRELQMASAEVAALKQTIASLPLNLDEQDIIRLKVQVIEELRIEEPNLPLDGFLRGLQISRQRYHIMKKIAAKPRIDKYEQVRPIMEKIFKEHDGKIGKYPMTTKLRDYNINLCVPTVKKLMNKWNLIPVGVTKTTD